MIEVVIRSETQRDIPAIHQINQAAFERKTEAALVDELRGTPAWLPMLSVVAQSKEEGLVAHAVLTRCHIGDTPALALGPCAVMPNQQIQGIGTRTIQAVLDRAKFQRERYVLVLGQPEYYPRFGFEPAENHGVTVDAEVPEGALMVLSLDGSQIPAGQVKYAEPFDLESKLL